MESIFIILLICILAFIYFYNNRNKENFESNCWVYGDNYNACYSDSKCTIGFLPSGATYCMKKFIEEDI